MRPKIHYLSYVWWADLFKCSSMLDPGWQYTPTHPSDWICFVISKWCNQFENVQIRAQQLIWTLSESILVLQHYLKLQNRMDSISNTSNELAWPATIISNDIIKAVLYIKKYYLERSQRSAKNVVFLSYTWI